MREAYDVVVVGGGAAGLGGALALCRARRSVLVVDAGEPRNAPAAHVHNYLTRDGAAPAELVAAGRDEVARYGGEIVAARADAATREANGFRVTLEAGHSVWARRLLVTTGLVDELPDVPGLAQRWGRDVLHCPYCHGWEVRDRRIGVLASSPLAVQQANLWRQWSPYVTLLTHHTAPPGPADAERLAARGVTMTPGAVVGLELRDDALTGVRLSSGGVVALDALAVAPTFTARVDFLESLGLKPVEVEVGGHVIGTQIPASPTGETAVRGVWVAGNVADVGGQVIAAVTAGMHAAAAINGDLVAEDTRDALTAYRYERYLALQEAAWEERYRAKPSVWSGQPNPQLVAAAAELTPGRAFDVGCGEGADAIWLAERGWRVTAVDISPTAVERATAHATTAGAEVARRVSWTCANLRDEAPEVGGYDLVTSQFMQLLGDARQALFARLAAAVAPSGTLLIVGHHPSDPQPAGRPTYSPSELYTAEEVAASLDPATWEVLAAEARPRAVVDPAGHEITVHDAVLVARRRG